MIPPALHRVLPVLLCAALGGTAKAEPLAFEGRLLVVLPALGEAEVASGVGVAEVDGLQVRSLEVLDASVVGSGGLPVTDPDAAPVTSIRIAASLRSGRLGIDPFAPPFGEPAITSGHVALPGSLQVCMRVSPFPPCHAGITLPLTQGDGAVGVGIGGVITFGGTGTVRVSLVGAPFTVNTAFATGATPSGASFTLFSTGSIGGPSLFTSTAGQPGGFLSIVTPIRTQSGQGGAAQNLVPGFLRLEIRFVPEPGVALLGGAGIVGLLAIARSRARRTREPSRPA